MPDAALVMGVGNAYRHDDGVGLDVVRAAAEGGVPEGVAVRRSIGDLEDLLDAFASFRAVCVVDAYDTATDVGRVLTLDALRDSLEATPPRTSSHAVGIADAVALARALEQLPERLCVVAVGAHDFSIGRGLSPPVAAAVPRALAEVRAWLANGGGHA